MSKWWLVGMLVIGLMLIGGAGVYADNGFIDGDSEPQGTEVDVWEWDDTAKPPTWTSVVTVGRGQPEATGAKARCFRAGGRKEGNCNKESWSFQFTNHASVAQWIDWYITATRWNWYVRKPGTYVANCIEAGIQSNYDVAISFTDFGDLEKIGDPSKTIPVKYAYGGGSPPALQYFVAPDELNDQGAYIPDDYSGWEGNLHDGLVYKLWNMIEVTTCTSACEYENTGTITITLIGIKNWIDPDTGNFKYRD